MDEKIFDIIKKEEAKQKEYINLIASENYVSEDILKALGSVLTNKYAEGYSGRRYYSGCEFVDAIEDIAIKRARELFDIDYVNVQPYSGTQANMAVYSSLLSPGDKILSLDLSCGGHISHGSKVSFVGKIYNCIYYSLDKITERIDMNTVREIAKKEKPKLIICGASAYSRDFDYKHFREIAEECGAFLMADIAHTAGIISAGRLNNPFEYCHVVTATTQKTLRGPRGGLILMKKDFENTHGLRDKEGKIKLMSEIIDSNIFPGIQGGPHMNTIAAKAICFKEAQSEDYKAYIDQVLKNAKKLAVLFQENGYHVVSGGTDNHMMLIDLQDKGITGEECQNILEENKILVNKNLIPFDKRSAKVTSGIRIGTAAITSRGYKEKDCEELFTKIDRIIKRKHSPTSALFGNNR